MQEQILLQIMVTISTIVFLWKCWSSKLPLSYLSVGVQHHCRAHALQSGGHGLESCLALDLFSHLTFIFWLFVIEQDPREVEKLQRFPLVLSHAALVNHF